MLLTPKGRAGKSLPSRFSHSLIDGISSTPSCPSQRPPALRAELHKILSTDGLDVQVGVLGPSHISF